MRFKNSIAACGLAALLATLIGAPAFAQSPPAQRRPSSVCANCHENAALDDHADGARRAERRQRELMPGVSRRRFAAPEGSDQEQAGERADVQDGDRGREIGACASPATVGRGISRTGPWPSTARSTSPASTATRSTDRSRRATTRRSRARSSRPRRTRRRSASSPTSDASSATATCAPRSSSPRTTRSSKARSAARTATTRTARSSRRACATTRSSDLCVSCHADKRGPWIHEHPPVEENCAICHTPHGSAHKGLLAQKPPALCSDCHANGHTHGIYDGRGTLPGTLPSNIRFVSQRLRQLPSADPRQQRAVVRLRRILPPLRPGDDHERQ